MSWFFLLSSLLSFGASPEASGKPVASYVVQKHDILGYISLKHYGTSRKWKKIARWNSIEDPRAIRPGQRIQLFENPTISLTDGQRLVADEKAKHRSLRAMAHHEKSPHAAVAKTKTPAEFANAVYGTGNYRQASILYAQERKKNPDRVTAWLYELSSLKLSGNREKFLDLRKDFLAKFPNLAQLELVKTAPRGLASKRH